jgi:hypothetical protein
VFGQRFIGLVDNQGVYSTYRVPNPEAPYPQDYIIDQQGIVRYWSDEYDPQEIMKIIDGLLATSAEENETGKPEQSGPRLRIVPNPTSSTFTIRAEGIKGNAAIIIYDRMGRSVHKESVAELRNATLTLELPSGEYFVAVEADGKALTESVTVTR